MGRYSPLPSGLYLPIEGLFPPADVSCVLPLACCFRFIMKEKQCRDKWMDDEMEDWRRMKGNGELVDTDEEYGKVKR